MYMCEGGGSSRRRTRGREDRNGRGEMSGANKTMHSCEGDGPTIHPNIQMNDGGETTEVRHRQRK